VEVVRAFLERAREVDTLVNCFIRLDQRAVDAAVELDRAGTHGPLHCIPYAYKDVFAHRGSTPTVGARGVRLDVRGTRATTLERLDGAGAVALGTLNLDQFAYAATGLNPDWGDTRNPWDRERIAGGSSSGAAAAVSAGAVPFAVGSDAGGSVRIPAAFCGVTGLKPTLGRIPKTGSVPLTYSQDTIGLLARSALDVALVLQHVAGHDPLDSSSIPAAVPRFHDELRRRLDAAGRPLRGLRLGFDEAAFAERTTAEIENAAKSALGVFVEAGAELVEIDLSILDRFDVAATVLTWAEASAVHGATYSGDPDLYSDVMRMRLELALAAHGADHVNALRLQGRALNELLAGVLAEVDVLVAPTVAGAPATIASLREGTAAEAARLSVSHLRLNRPFNFVGVPALSIPIGFDRSDLPMAFQVAGRPWSEPTLLACGAVYQSATDWHLRMPPLRVASTATSQKERAARHDERPGTHR
jgi:aspartyl-tRNA(Asn)/glutamyl-tRNA(Gln) amidotransferase subunit A